jgi:hypothetical protein
MTLGLEQGKVNGKALKGRYRSNAGWSKIRSWTWRGFKRGFKSEKKIDWFDRALALGAAK